MMHFLPSDVRRALAWGTTWGLAVAVCEALAISPQRWESPQLLLWWWLTYWAVPFWCAGGALLVWLLSRAADLAGRRGMILCYIALGPLVAFIQPLISAGMMRLTIRFFPELYRYALQIGAVPMAASRSSLAVANLWVYYFYAGLLTAAYMLTLRTERSRSLLHEIAMARSRTEGLLDAQRLEALQTQIDPNLLLQTMRELEQRYRWAPERGESLLEALVEFLRYAMHGLRVPVSTLDAELRLARAFAQLQQERGVAGAWHVEDVPAEIQGNWKFPSHLMLPLLTLAGAAEQPLLRTTSEGSRTVLQFFGLTHRVSTDLRQQLHARLQALYGDGFRLDYSSLAPTRLAIVLTHGLTT